MIVRCGSCRIELEVGGPGEFQCPSCGTRNVVRDRAEPAPSLAYDLEGAPPPSEPVPGITWVVCPSCRYRFAVGEISEVPCPVCAASLAVSELGTAELRP